MDKEENILFVVLFYNNCVITKKIILIFGVHYNYFDLKMDMVIHF